MKVTESVKLAIEIMIHSLWVEVGISQKIEPKEVYNFVMNDIKKKNIHVLVDRELIRKSLIKYHG